MLNTFKHYAKQACLVVAILLFTISCEKEEVIISETPKSPIAVTTIDAPVIEQNTNLFESISNLNTSLKRNKLRKGKSDGFSEDYDFVINTEVANYITNNTNGYHSYTFVIEREEETSHIENIVFSLKADGSYLTHLVKYYTTKEQKEAFILGESLDLDGVRGGFKEISIDSRNNFNDDYACEDPDSWDCVLYAYEAFIGSDGDGKCYTVSTNGSFPVFDEVPCLTEEGGNMGGQGAGNLPGGNIYPNGTGTGTDGGLGNSPGGGTTTTGGNTNTGGNTTTTSPVPPRPFWDNIDRCINGLVIGGDNTTIDKTFLEGLTRAQITQINSYITENECSEDSQKEAIEDILEIYVLNCISHLTISNLNHLSFENLNAIANIIKNDGCNELNKKFIENAINVLEEDPEANPLLGADCRSFEYAQPPGAFQKGCAVKDFDHTFYTAGIRSNGSPYYGEIDIPVNIIYFTMPNMMTNGKAANLTAVAITNAIKLTDAHFFNNPDITKYNLANFFENQIRIQLAIFGGSFSTTVEPFPIPSPASYITSVLGISDPFDCE